MYIMTAWLKVLEEKNISKWPWDHSCIILAKNVAVFYPNPALPPNLPDSKQKSFQLMALTEAISSKLSTNCVVWLLVVTLKQTYDEQASWTRRNTKCTVWKGTPGNIMGLSSVLKDIRNLKFDAKWNKGSDDLGAGPTQLSFQLVTRNLKK